MCLQTRFFDFIPLRNDTLPHSQGGTFALPCMFETWLEALNSNRLSVKSQALYKVIRKLSPLIRRLHSLNQFGT